MRPLPLGCALTLLVASLCLSSCTSSSELSTTSSGKTNREQSTASTRKDTGREEKPSTSAVKVDPKLPEYKRTEGVSGTIKSVGSDTMNNLMTLWAEGFKKHYPSVQVEIQGAGSSTAPTALIAGTANFGPMSRPMKDKEIDDFKAKYKYEPTALPTSIDMLAVYVHKDNPIKGLTFKQLRSIFSKKPDSKDIKTWGDLGLTGEWANRKISHYGRNAASGTYGYFKEHALGNADFKDEVREQPGSAAVVGGVAGDKGGIGYSGIGYKTSDVRAVPLAQEGNEFVPADPERAYTGDYPLARYLFVYVNYDKNQPLDPLRREFIKYVFSKDGQLDVLKDGYLPIVEKTHQDALKSVGIQ